MAAFNFAKKIDEVKRVGVEIPIVFKRIRQRFLINRFLVSGFQEVLTNFMSKDSKVKDSIITVHFNNNIHHFGLGFYPEKYKIGINQKKSTLIRMHAEPHSGSFRSVS